MEYLKDGFLKGIRTSFGRVLNRDLFLFFLDLEVKRARRYQNFLCLIFLKIKPFSKGEDGGGLDICHQILKDVLTEEIRESDIIGFFEMNRLAVILPYADVKAGDYVKSRMEDILQYYDFKSKGFEIVIDQVCFPVHGADTMDLIRRALTSEPS